MNMITPIFLKMIAPIQSLVKNPCNPYLIIGVITIMNYKEQKRRGFWLKKR